MTCSEKIYSFNWVIFSLNWDVGKDLIDSSIFLRAIKQLFLDELFVFQSQNHKYKRNNVINLRILPLIENHHFLLCTLLLFNALANEALPIFLDAVLPAWAAGHILIIISLILYFFPHFGTFAFSLNIGNSGVIVRRDSAHSHLHRSRSACHRV